MIINDKLIYEKRDEMGRVIAASYSDRDDYKNGEVPYYVIEFFRGEEIYEREGDTVLFGK